MVSEGIPTTRTHPCTESERWCLPDPLREVIDDLGTWQADGLVSLADLERSVGLRVPVDLDVNPLSGLCMQRLGRMPQVGDEVTESGYRIRVCTLEDRRVGLVSIERERLGEPVEEGEGVETSSDGAP